MTLHSQLDFIAPQDCRLCPRLAEYIDSFKLSDPSWYNGPVPSFGARTARILVLGLAPGLRGANRTGRPFTGDFAGQVLYDALLKHKFATGSYHPDGQDELNLHDIRISNAVRCVPPQNKPVGAEIATCRQFLQTELSLMPELKALLVLGRIAHETVLRHFELKPSDYPFQHNGRFTLPDGLSLISSYHCSRYNVQTNRLSIEMFDTVISGLTEFRAGDRTG